jgi:hypothetical protein
MADDKQPSVLGEARNALGEFVLMLALFGIGGGIIAAVGIAIDGRNLQLVVGAVAVLILAVAALLLLKLLQRRKRTCNVSK